MLAAPAALLLVVAAAYAQFADNAAIAGALRGMSAVAAGMIAAMGLKLAVALRAHPMGPVLAALVATVTALGVGWLHVPLPWVLLVLGTFACGMTLRKLGPA